MNKIKVNEKEMTEEEFEEFKKTLTKGVKLVEKSAGVFVTRIQG